MTKTHTQKRVNDEYGSYRLLKTELFCSHITVKRQFYLDNGIEFNESARVLTLEKYSLF